MRPNTLPSCIAAVCFLGALALSFVQPEPARAGPTGTGTQWCAPEVVRHYHPGSDVTTGLAGVVAAAGFTLESPASGCPGSGAHITFWVSSDGESLSGAEQTVLRDALRDAHGGHLAH